MYRTLLTAVTMPRLRAVRLVIAGIVFLLPATRADAQADAAAVVCTGSFASDNGSSSAPRGAIIFNARLQKCTVVHSSDERLEDGDLLLSLDNDGGRGAVALAVGTTDGIQRQQASRIQRCDLGFLRERFNAAGNQKCRAGGAGLSSPFEGGAHSVVFSGRDSGGTDRCIRANVTVAKNKEFDDSTAVTDSNPKYVFTFNSGYALSNSADCPEHARPGGGTDDGLHEDDVDDIDDNAVRTRTSRIITNFMAQRADQLTAAEPDLAARLGGFGGGFAAGDGSLKDHRFAFATSLRQLLNANAARRRARQQMLLGNIDTQVPTTDSGVNATGLGLTHQERHGDALRFDLWTKGQWSRSDNGRAAQDLGLLYIGADYRVASNMVVGVLAQFDWAADDNDSYAAKGRGWMIGPYIAARLHDNLVFDGRVAWGKSNNEVSPTATYRDDVRATRWLAKAQLTGDADFGGLKIQPHAGIIYFTVTHDAYTDGLAIDIPSQRIKLGRVTFGPKVATTLTRPDGTTIAPYVTVKGIWDFDKADIVDLDTGLAPSGASDLRARVEGGFTVATPLGTSLTGEGFFDGIGDSRARAYGGHLRLTMPLHNP